MKLILLEYMGNDNIAKNGITKNEANEKIEELTKLKREELRDDFIKYLETKPWENK